MSAGTFALGDKGEAVVKFGLDRIYRDLRTTPKDIETQLIWADLVRPGVSSLGVSAKRIEVKTEHEHTGNLFFETLSNVHTGRLGWAVTSTADELYYLFWDNAIGYRLPNFQHVKFHFDYCKNDFKERDQYRHKQNNLTRGRLVPIKWVLSLHVGATKFDFTEIKARIEKNE